MTTKAVTLIGIGDDGCLGLSSRAVNAVAQAQVLAGGQRQLAFFPQFSGLRIVLKHGIEDAIDRLAELAAENNVCILASGDPLFFGIGARVIQRIGSAHVEVLPQPSAMQWAFAKVGVPWDDAAFISLHGRPRQGLLAKLSRRAKAACFTDAENAPRNLADYLLSYGQRDWRAWVCENLGGSDERVREFSLQELSVCDDIAPLNVLILVRSDPRWRPPPVVPFLPEEAFQAKQGLITKREVRLLSLAALQLRPQSVLWDIGAGSGSVAIEAAMLAYDGRVYAVEADPECLDLCRRNVHAHAADNVQIVAGQAPEALADLEDPDAVFIGGSKGLLRPIVELGLRRLRCGGRLVINAVTLDGVAEAYAALIAQKLVPEVTLLNISRGRPLGDHLLYEALNPIHVFAVTKP